MVSIKISGVPCRWLERFLLCSMGSSTTNLSTLFNVLCPSWSALTANLINLLDRCNLYFLFLNSKLGNDSTWPTCMFYPPSSSLTITLVMDAICKLRCWFLGVFNQFCFFFLIWNTVCHKLNFHSLFSPVDSISWVFDTQQGKVKLGYWHLKTKYNLRKKLEGGKKSHKRKGMAYRWATLHDLTYCSVVH